MQPVADRNVSCELINLLRMKKFIFLLALPIFVEAQSDYSIETTDITNFWRAYDMLQSAVTTEDSISIIQKNYIDISTDYFKEFIRVRNFTAEEYTQKIGLYPKFWESVRPLTENIVQRKSELLEIFTKYQSTLPNYQQPDVCFAIGTLRTGGTTTSGLILIGSEIASSNAQVDKSEMTGWLASVIGNSGDILAMIAHEIIHTQQINRRKSTLLSGVLTEGIADFLSEEIIGVTINEKIYEYGNQHHCELKKEFIKDLKEHPKDFNRWLYQGSKSKDRPADLGYFIGYQIAKRYYNKQQDKQAAIDTLLNAKKYKQILKDSGYLDDYDCK